MVRRLCCYYLSHFIVDAYFESVGVPAKIVIRDLDYASLETYPLLTKLLDRVEKSQYVKPGSLQNWYASYMTVNK